MNFWTYFLKNSHKMLEVPKRFLSQAINYIIILFMMKISYNYLKYNIFFFLIV